MMQATFWLSTLFIMALGVQPLVWHVVTHNAWLHDWFDIQDITEEDDE